VDIAVGPAVTRVFRELRKPTSVKRLRHSCAETHEVPCSVCLLKMPGVHARTSCNHCFHYHCINDYIEAVEDLKDADGNKITPKCPLCRRPMEPQKISMFFNASGSPVVHQVGNLAQS
jgi:hypothetical protein